MGIMIHVDGLGGECLYNSVNSVPGADDTLVSDVAGRVDKEASVNMHSSQG